MGEKAGGHFFFASFSFYSEFTISCTLQSWCSPLFRLEFRRLSAFSRTFFLADRLAFGSRRFGLSSPPVTNGSLSSGLHTRVLFVQRPLLRQEEECFMCSLVNPRAFDIGTVLGSCNVGNGAIFASNPQKKCVA